MEEMPRGCLSSIAEHIRVLSVILDVSTGSWNCDLYSEGDNLVCAKKGTLTETIRRNQWTWLVEFYSSWCGHCQYFAPTWKKFAHSLENWSPVVRIAVIDCPSNGNLDVCRKFDIGGYPTIKMFHAGSDDSDVGEDVDAREVSSLRHTVIKLIESSSRKPSSWPAMEPVQSYASLQDLLKKERKKNVAIVFEASDSFLGRELMLEMISQPYMLVLRVTKDQSDLCSKLNVNIFPTLLTYTATKRVPEIVKCQSEDASGFKEALHRWIGGVPEVGETEQSNPKDKKSRSVQAEFDHHSKLTTVYAEDLVGALSYAFRHEVLLQRLIGRRLKVLASFVNAVDQCLPLPGNTKRIISQINSKLSLALKSGNLEASSWNRMINKQRLSNSLPDPVQWHGCKGREPHLRGYPCSLWTLMHTMVTNCAKKFVHDCPATRSLASSGQRLVVGREGIGAYRLLLIARDFIGEFFSCVECRNHFLEMARDLDETKMTARDGVLWLWRAHNMVNDRLKNDPLLPKIQFPSTEDCSQCCLASDANSECSKWDEDRVLCFLLETYQLKSIRVGAETKPARSQGNERVPSLPHELDSSWTFCRIFYFGIFLVLVLLFRKLLKSRRCRRRKTKNALV